MSYILPSKVEVYALLYDKEVKSGKFTQVDRERSLQLLMRINLLKRIESSVDAFRLTIENILNQIYDALKAILKGEESTYSGLQINTDSEDLDWEPDWGDEESIIGKKVKVHIKDMDVTRWEEDLNSDREILENLLKAIAEIKGEKDLKLAYLKNNISAKITRPINEGNKKIIIFTAFADTANYLYKSLKTFVKNEFNINSSLITGSKRLSSTKNIPTDLNTLLTCFSPISKNKNLTHPNITEEIDLIIATDCISEGQNLQDCDYLINYDIHWNPVRIIQRFGRIDRIGSINSNITMVNFWPDINNHILFLLVFDDSYLLSASQKHIHPTNENFAVIDWIFTTDWFNADGGFYKFNLKKNLDFVFADMIYQITGKQQTAELNIADLISKEQKIKQLTSRIDKLKSEIKKCRQFNRKVKLNLELQECENTMLMLDERKT